MQVTRFQYISELGNNNNNTTVYMVLKLKALAFVSELIKRLLFLMDAMAWRWRVGWIPFNSLGDYFFKGNYTDNEK